MAGLEASPEGQPQVIRTHGAPAKVYTELGVDIYFNPSDREFSADMNARLNGRGSSSKLHSTDFDAVVQRIRSRALVAPVDAYTLYVDSSAYRNNAEARVTVTPCTVVEYHKGRQEPFVIIKTAEETVRQHRTGVETKRVVRRYLMEDRVYLPTPEQIEALRAAAQEHVDVQVENHRREADARAKLQAAANAVTQLTAADLKYVQQSGEQKAVAPEDLGALVYTLDEVPDGEEEAAETPA